MTAKYLSAIARKHYKGYSPKRIAFLKKLSVLIDNYEQSANEIIGCKVIFTYPQTGIPFDKRSWNGHYFDN